MIHAKFGGLQLKLPRFIPVLTAFATRVSGRELDQLLQSSTVLARSLADTQAVVGQDGILCAYVPPVLVSACIRQRDDMAGDTKLNGITTRPAAEVLQSKPLDTVLESLEALRHLVPDRVQVFATFAGPGLLHTQLQEAFASRGTTAWDDPDYVSEVVLAAVRCSLDMKADGIALIEQLSAAMTPELLRVHKKVRKLADFYDAAFLVFNEQLYEENQPVLPAHCIFDLGSVTRGIGPVIGRLEQSLTGYGRPSTTAGDIPAGTNIGDLKSLWRAM